MIIINGEGEVSGGGGAPSGLGIFWMSGAEHEAAVAEKWHTSTGSSIVTGVTDADGRVYQVTAGGQPRMAFPFAIATPAFVSARMRFQPVNVSTGTLILFRNSSNGGLCAVRYVSDGAFEVMNGESTSSLQKSSTGLISTGNWYEIEFQSLVDDSGSWTAKVWNDSGTLLETLSGSGDTRAGSIFDVAAITFGNTATDPYFDNISVDLNGNLLGRCKVVTRYPTGNGDLNQWPRGGTDTGNNYSQVNETIKNTTSWVESNAADQYDFYTISLASLGGTMKALQVNAIGRAGAAGTQQFKLALRIGGVTYEDSVTQEFASTGSDRNRYAVWSNNPATGNAWDGSETVQIGYKSVTGLVRIQQCVAEILVQL